MGVYGREEKGLRKIKWLWKYLGCYVYLNIPFIYGVPDSFSEIQIPQLNEIKPWD